MQGGIAVKGGIHMARGTLARIEDGSGVWIHVWDGALWITLEGDRRDYFVKPGDSFELGRDGVTVVYAQRRTVVTLTAPVPAYFAKRISLALPGSSAPHVLYDSAQEPGGWLGGLRHRLTRWWTNSYAHYSNPTTAAL